MTAVDETPVASPVAAEAVGDRLRAAREARGLSIADIAQTLKFSPRQVELVEGSAWAELPGQTFVRGCVRTYARLLQLDPGPLLRDLESANLPKAPDLAVPGTTNATLPMPGNAGSRDLLTVLTGLLVVVIAATAYVLIPDDFWRSRGDPAAAAASKPAAPPAAVAQAPVLPATAAVPVADASPATPPAPAPGGETAAVPVLPPPAEAPSAENRVRFEFTRASWVEVRDSNGVLLHSQNNAAGTVQEVSGTIPMSIVIGDAGGVRMIYKDKPVDLAAYTKPNSSVARLNIE